MNARELADLVRQTLHEASSSTERAQQQARHVIGVSDLGSCREYTRRMLTQTPFSDDPPKWAAFVGTALGDYVEERFVAAHPEWRRQVTVDIALPSGVTITGHIDLLGENLIADVKTVAGTDMVRRTGPSQQQSFQRTLYALGAIQAGLVDEDKVQVANIWLDRSGSDPEPYVHMEPFRPDIVVEADNWLSDVLYAIRYGERASLDKPLHWCQVACEYFSDCRGDTVPEGLIEDPELLAAVQAWLEGADLEKQAKQMRSSARRQLLGVNGSTGTHVVRTVHVNGGDVPGFFREPSTRLEVRALPKPRTR